MNSSPTTPRSYYAATAHPTSQHEPLRGEVVVDVCVVGGGIAGCSTALHLAERGYSVALLEAEHIAWGASGRSGGQVLTGFASGQHKLVDQLGLETARKLWNISVEGVELVRALIERHRIDCDLHWGQMHVAIKERHRRELQSDLEEAQTLYGYSRLRTLDGHEVRSLLATDRYCAGVLDSGSGHLHPFNYTLGLARAAEVSGVQIFEHSRVSAIEHGDPAVVRTEQGSVRSKFVVLCCNAYIDKLAPQLRARIMPVGTYIIATQSLGLARIEELIRENIAVTDMNFVLDYFRRSADHRLIFGGRVSYSGVDAFDTARATRKRMLRVFPQLKNAAIDYSWGGFVDITMTRAPDFGRISPNIYYLQGFSGHGIALTGIAGKLVAEAVAGHAERFDLFTRLRHREFPGGAALRTPALVLAMLWYRLRDLL